jgi:hypothetical protein
MRTLGKITAGVGAAAAVIAVVVVVRSAPDIRRYLKMRSM